MDKMRDWIIAMNTDTRMKWKTGMILSAIIMAIVAAGQLTIHDFIVKGTPIQSLCYTCGFILIFFIIQATEMKSYGLTHRIYVEIEHIRAYHIKEYAACGMIGFGIGVCSVLVILYFGGVF